MEETEELWQLKNVTGVSDNAANITNAFVKKSDSSMAFPILGALPALLIWAFQRVLMSIK